MLRYLSDNKHWIFSGIGVFAISLLVSGIIYFSRPHSVSNQDSKQDLNNSDPATTPTPKMSEPTPIQIKDTVSRLPPLQQEDVARGYVGIKVDWELDFNSASRNEFASKEAKEDIVDISFHVPGQRSTGATVWCWRVKLAAYREFKVMTSGKRVRLTGVISHVDNGGDRIDLKDVNFTVL